MAEARGRKRGVRSTGASRRRPATEAAAESATRRGDTEARSVPAPEFFNALAISLDALQRQLANANNSFADFVVKEFTVDTPLRVTMNTVGGVRFVLPDETTRPELLTRMTMVLTPVAKAPDAPGVAVADDQRTSDRTPITESAIIPAGVAGQLLEQDIRTVGDFLGVVADARFSVQLASVLRVERAELGRWADQIRLQDAGQLTTRQVRILEKLEITGLAQVAALTEKQVAAIPEQFPRDFPPDALARLIELARARVPPPRLDPVRPFPIRPPGRPEPVEPR